MNKRQLASTIEQLKVFDKQHASVKLEQYPTDALATAELAFIAGFMYNDVKDNLVLDLGAGTGRIAAGALLMGGRKAICIEIDAGALAIAMDNFKFLGLGNRAELINADVLSCPLRKARVKNGFGKTIIMMNPPFGIQTKGADLKFLQVAMEFEHVDVIYSFHATVEKNRAFIRKKVEEEGWFVDALFQTRMFLPHIYAFHEKRRKEIKVDLYRIAREKSTVTGHMQAKP
nr:METTL5 family protein [Candidatus Sigynarchaeota archaeon]